ncbi:MAG: tail fiber domain-containing protein, partial [Bacteroidota bacterium]
FQANAATRMFINQDGDIGIGTVSPLNRLDINGDLALSSGTGGIRFYEGTEDKASIIWDGDDLLIRNRERNPSASNDVTLFTPNGDINFTTASSNLRMRIQEEGGMRLYAPNNNSYLMRVPDNGNLEFVGDGGAVAMTINDGNGNVGIGGTTLSHTATISHDGSPGGQIFSSNNGLLLRNTGNNNIRWLQYVTNSNGNYAWLRNNNTVRAVIDADNGNWVPGSDRKLKKDIQSLSSAQLEKIMQLSPKSYLFKSQKNARRSFGLIAQEVQKIYPNIVVDMGEKKGEQLGVSYTELIPVLITGIQEQQVQIETLEERIEQLEQLILKSSNTQSIEIETTPNSYHLKQNQPNPFSETTIIEYAVPKEANESKIIFTDLNGSVIKKVVVNGTGQLEITTPDLPAGTYTYSLVVDGKIVATNKMVLAK